MAERSYRGVLWGVALFGTALDQVTKYGVFNWLYPPPGQDRGECQVVHGAFMLVAEFTKEKSTGLLSWLQTLSGDRLPHVNRGALFGWKAFLDIDKYPQVPNCLFAAVSVIAALAILFWSLRRATARDFALCAALGLILAGTLGNLYDRLVFDGVRDFLYFYWIEWPVFNVADCCLVCGAFLLLVQAFWSPAAASRQGAARTALARQVVEVN
jgi:lipoprotein signal peptidase